MQFAGRAVRIVALTLAVSGLAACSREASVSGPPLKSMVEQEYAFAAHSVAHGMRAAFMEYLAPDGILFRPTPVSAQTWLGQQPDTPGTLSWYPEMAGVSSDGTMGYSTGPYRYERAGGGEPGFGHFLSVWRLQRNGAWRVAIDAGISHPEPERPPEKLSKARPGGDRGQAGNARLSGPGLAEVVASYRRLFALEGEAAALERLGAPNVCLFREGELPIHGRAASVAYLQKTHVAGGASDEPQGMVEAANLAYSYGLRRTASDLAGVYLRVWRITDGEWRLFLDLVQPAG